MKVAVAPASPKTAAAAIRTLLHHTSTDGKPIEVRAFYRDTKRAPVEFTSKSNFVALKAVLDDPASLDFSGIDAVIVITPPGYDGAKDLVKHAEDVSHGVKEAIERAGYVKKLVLLSSSGAHLSEGVGEIKTNNRAEVILSQTKVPSITFVRGAYFMENWSSSVDTLKAPEPFFFSTVTPLDYQIPMVAARDVGAVLAREALSDQNRSQSPYIYKLQGPQDYSPNDVRAVFTKALGGRSVAINAVESDQLPEFYSKIFPANVAAEFVEMTRSFLPGGKMRLEPDPVEREIVRGKTGLEEALTDILKAASLA